MKTTCADCKGLGTIYPDKANPGNGQRCPTCQGTGTIVEKVEAAAEQPKKTEQKGGK